MSEEIEKYKQAWKEYQEKILSLKKEKIMILEKIHKKMDQQKITSIIKRMKSDE